MRIPLPTGMKSIPELPKAREAVVNMIRHGDALIPRPGIQDLLDYDGVSRAALTFANVAYFVKGQSLVRFNDPSDVTRLGSLAGTGRVNHDQGLAGAVLVDSAGGSAYVLTDAGFHQISDPLFKPVRDVAYIDGYYVFVPLDGSALFFSEVLDPDTYPAENFFDAETIPDRNRGVRNFRNDLYVMGEEGCEVFRTTGDVNAPFSRVGGGAIPVGLVAAHIEYGPSFAFIGKRKYNDYGIFVMGSGVAEPISNSAVEYILNHEYSAFELGSAFANRFVWRGVEVVTFHLPRHTLAFYGDWAVFETGSNGEANEPWAGQAILFRRGEYLVGGESGIGTLGGNTDFDSEVDRGFDTFVRSERGQHIRLSDLELDCLTGQEAMEYRVSLCMSNDARIWGQRFWQPIGTTGHYQQRVGWTYPGGLGTYESYAGIRIRTTEDVTFALDGLQVTVR